MEGILYAHPVVILSVAQVLGKHGLAAARASCQDYRRVPVGDLEASAGRHRAAHQALEASLASDDGDLLLLTLGIDLAAQPRNTGMCAIEWRDGVGTVRPPVVGVDDEALLDAMQGADWTAIDAPFGWPIAFSEAVHCYTERNTWPADPEAEHLRLRETDRFVRDRIEEYTGMKLTPMSPSVDRLGSCALRCAALLTSHAERSGWTFDRVGGQRGQSRPERGVIDVYPAGALAIWGLPHKAYKRPDGHPLRKQIVDGLAEASGVELRFEPSAEDLCVSSDHSTDALVAAVIARVAATGGTELPLASQEEAAAKEGWIHLPTRGSTLTETRREFE